MQYAVKNLKTLKSFLSDRPNLKNKVDEALAILGVENYTNHSPIIKTISVIGGDERYLDNGTSVKGGFVGSSAELQTIEIEVQLKNNQYVSAKTIQRKTNGELKTTIYYSEGLYGGKKGKKNFTEVIEKFKSEIETGVNPFQKQLDNAKNNLQIHRGRVSKLKKEVEGLESYGEKFPLALNHLHRELSDENYNVIRAEEKLKEIQTMFDKASA